MAHLIDKSALVAEIERLRKNQRLDDRHDQGVLDGLHAIERYIEQHILTIIPVKGAENIEYVRKDAFIEKACDWLKENGGIYWMDDYDLPTDDLVNDFKKYMEGE